MSELPPGWAETTIGEITSYVSRGKSPKYTGKSRLPVINQKAIRWHGIQDEHLKYVHEDQFDQWTTERFIQAGDILWNSTGTGTIGRACLVRAEHLNPPKVVDSHVTIVRPNTAAVESRFLFAWVRGPEVQNGLEDLASGSTNQIELNRSTVVATRVPLAPLPEQRRIADKLDALLARVDACRERLDRVPGILKRFRQSVLTAATSGELTREWREERRIQGEWREPTLGSLLTDVRYGTSKKCAYEPRKTPVLRIPNVAGGTVSHEDLKYADFEEGERAKLALAPGDLLIIRSNGSVGLVGRTALVSEREAGFLYAGYLIRLRPDAAQSSPAYLSLFLASPASRTRIELTARSTTGVNNINAEEIRAFPVALPSLDEQYEIVRRVGELFAMADRLDNRVSSAQAIVQRTTPSALEKTFRGELVPQNPNDESAAALIKRTREGSSTPPQRLPSSASRRPRQRKELDAMVKKLIDVLAEAGDWMTAQEAFGGCGISEGATTDLVEALYTELRQLERDKRVVVEPVRNARGVKLHDRLKIIAKG